MTGPDATGPDAVPDAVMDANFVLRVFLTGLGRPPAPGEADDFKALLRRSEDAVAGDRPGRERVAEAVIALPEFVKLHGAGEECTEPFLYALVRNAMGRVPTKAEQGMLGMARDRVSALVLAAEMPALLRRHDPFALFCPDGASPDDDCAYGLWARRYDTFAAAEREVAGSDAGSQAGLPRIALLLDVTACRPDRLAATIGSVRAQICDGWTLSMAGSGLSPDVTRILQDHARSSPDIRFCQVAEGAEAGMAPDGAVLTGAALYEAGDEPFVAFLNCGDELAPDAVMHIARALAADPGTVLLFTDEDVRGDDGWRRTARLKPGWSEDQLLAGDTVGQLAVFSRRRIEEAGGFATATACACDSEAGAVSDEAVSRAAVFYALKLAVAEGVSRERVRHLPRILFHGRYFQDLPPFVLARSGPDAPLPAGRRIAASHLARWRSDVRLTEASLLPDAAGGGGEKGDGPLWPRVLYPLPRMLPTVSVIIPTRDSPGLLRQCVTGLLNKTDYAALDVVIVDNGSSEDETLCLLRELDTDARVTILRLDFPFNWSRLNNEAVRSCGGDLILLLNDDIEILHPDWLEEMVRQIMRRDVGVVGARLLYPDGTLQHGGVVLSEDGATHILRGAAPDDPGYLGQLVWQRDLLAVTGACLLMRRDVWERVGGLDEAFRVTCNDIDLCLRVIAAGWRVVWTPHAVLTHLDGATRGRDVSIARQWLHCAETARLVGRWHRVMRNDPAINPALHVTDTRVLLAWPPPPDHFDGGAWSLRGERV
ncbi:glycosyltransferase [Acetobacter musti]|uniref:Glycosyltransferase n=1 Tax=Acetobacter musti TaxID=864732 RepID=A0ABX0JQK3_9PROT|nr:glycosyltransferase family 2 protein [Acetobacter musti]NHN84771.1 glycosyltransferase [Acetobacter musti]